MTKARAFGADAVHLIAKETVYGTAPSGTGGGVYRRLPLRENSVGREQELEDDPTWNLGTSEDGDPALGASTVTGNIVAPLDVRGAGLLLTMVLGAPTTVDNGDGTFTHTWKSGADLFSYALQMGHPKLAAPKWRTVLGAKAGGLSFPMARNGRVVATVPIIGQSEVKDTTGARDAAPLTYEYLPFDNASGSIKVGGAALANITAAQIDFSNNLETADDIRPDMAIGGVDESRRSGNGSVTARLSSDATLDDLADTKTPAALEYGFSLISEPTWTLKFQLPRVFFPPVKKPVTGPGGVSFTANWRAARDATAGYLMAAVLVNDVASYA